MKCENGYSALKAVLEYAHLHAWQNEGARDKPRARDVKVSPVEKRVAFLIGQREALMSGTRTSHPTSHVGNGNLNLRAFLSECPGTRLGAPPTSLWVKAERRRDLTFCITHCQLNSVQSLPCSNFVTGRLQWLVHEYVYMEKKERSGRWKCNRPTRLTFAVLQHFPEPSVV